MIKHALILAAGRGERLRPLTLHQPKPMIPVKQLPLLAHHIIRLAQAGVQQITISHAYLGDQIRQYFQQGQDFGVHIQYAAEPPGSFNAGGSLIHALPYLHEQPFVLISADIFTDYPFAQLNNLANSLAHLVLTAPTPGSKADFGLDAQQCLSLSAPQYTYAGIAYFHPHIFQDRSWRFLAFGTLIRTLHAQVPISGELYQGQLLNVGTAAQLAAACATSCDQQIGLDACSTSLSNATGPFQSHVQPS